MAAPQGAGSSIWRLVRLRGVLFANNGRVEDRRRSRHGPR